MTFLDYVSNMSFEIIIECYGAACTEQYKSIYILLDIYHKIIKMKIQIK